jgi:hypothetical protein
VIVWEEDLDVWEEDLDNSGVPFWIEMKGAYSMLLADRFTDFLGSY